LTCDDADRFLPLALVDSPQEKFKYDDSLDVFGVHGVGGFVGTILLGVFGSPVFGGFNAVPILTQTSIQAAAALFTVA
jgi:ammonia channel protein AmtB